MHLSLLSSVSFSAHELHFDHCLDQNIFREADTFRKNQVQQLHCMGNGPSLSKQSNGSTSTINLAKWTDFSKCRVGLQWLPMYGKCSFVEQCSASQPSAAHRSPPALFLAPLVSFHYHCFPKRHSYSVKRPEMVQNRLCLYSTFFSELSTKKCSLKHNDIMTSSPIPKLRLGG